MKYLALFFFIPLLSNCQESVESPEVENKPDNIIITKVCDLPSEAYESSGIIYFQELLWTINDSGNDPELIVVDTSTGEVERIIEVQDVVNVDWEALYQDEQYLYVADNGNNGGSRDSYQIYVISKDSLQDKNKREVLPSRTITYTLSDSDLSKIGHTQESIDSEAILVSTDSIFIFVKDWLEYKTYAFVIGLDSDTSVAKLGGEYNLRFASTAATRLDENRFAILGYKDYRAYLSVFTMSANLIGDHVEVASYELFALQGQQTEGLTYSNGTLFISCENMSVFSQALYRVELPNN